MTHEMQSGLMNKSQLVTRKKQNRGPAQTGMLFWSR